jgi:site-specific DNA-methyltransferase (adenine-specific)
MKALMSSDKMDWGTPQELFDVLHGVFDFRVDAAASSHNAKCDRYFSESPGKCGLVHQWPSLPVFCNPPYGRQIGQWVNKAYLETEHMCPRAVLLVPSRTETAWFQTMWKARALVFIRGRLRFEGANNSAPFPSVLGVFGKRLKRWQTKELETIGKVIIP